MTITWEDALTDCESRLDAATAALELGKPAAIAPFSEAEIEGPLPAELRIELEQRFAAELERVRTELRRLPRMPRVPAGTRFEAQA